MPDATRPPNNGPSPGRRGARSRHRATPDDTWTDALSGLPRRQRGFVRAAVAGADYEAAARAAGYRSLLAVPFLLGQRQVADALRRLAPLLTDQRHARKLLEPFALQALAGNLTGDAPHASRATAAREIVAPVSGLDTPPPGAPPGSTSAGGAGGPGRDWTRRKADRDARREAARAGLALVPSATGPHLEPRREDQAPPDADAPDRRTDGEGAAGQEGQGESDSATPPEGGESDSAVSESAPTPEVGGT